MRIYPTRDSEPEIRDIIYEVNFDLKTETLVEPTKLSEVDFDFLQEQIRKCKMKIMEKDFDGAVTNARTLLETICIFIIENKTNNSYNNNDGSLPKMYKEATKLIKMDASLHNDENIKKILSGATSIIQGVSGLRNSNSDAHGISSTKKNYRIDERHAVLVVNTAISIAEYLYFSYSKSNNN